MAMRFGKLYKGTPAEHALEDAVAALGVPYRTNFPMYLYGARFFPDVLLPTLGAVLEVDDASHSQKTEADAERTERLRVDYGWRVARCTNEEALTDPHGAVRRMLLELGLWPLPTRLPKLADSLPSPRSAPQKERRAAKSEARQRRRRKSN